MPDRLPLRIFLKKAAAHTARNLAYWLRGGLVASTWLIWLPWTMRFVWWGLFWLADVGWVKDPYTYSKQANVTYHPNSTDLANATSNELRSALITEIIKGPQILRLTMWMLRLLVYGNDLTWFTEANPDNYKQTQALISNSTEVSERGTLLSGVQFLTSMTSNPQTNRVIVDILEGQIITLSLVALIILILLIREWVVQQQPIAHPVNGNDEMRRAMQRHARDGERRAAGNEGQETNGTSPLEYDGVVRSLLNGLGEEPDINSNKTTVDAIKTLVDRAHALGDALKLDEEEPDRPEEVILEARTVAKDAVETSIAIGSAYAQAVRNEDIEQLRQIRHANRKFQDLIPMLPKRTSYKVAKFNRELRRSMRGMMAKVKARQRRTRVDGRAESGSRLAAEAAMPGERSNFSSTSTSSSEEWITEDDQDSRTSSPELRPVMPPRDESFVATEIQRNLQEGLANVSEERTRANDPVPKAKSGPQLEEPVEGSPLMVDETFAADSKAENVEDMNSTGVDDKSRDYTNSTDLRKDIVSQYTELDPTKMSSGSEQSGEGQSASAEAREASALTDNTNPPPIPALEDRSERSNGREQTANPSSATDPESAEAAQDGSHSLDHEQGSKGFVSSIGDWLWGDLESRGPNGTGDAERAQDHATNQDVNDHVLEEEVAADPAVEDDQADHPQEVPPAAINEADEDPNPAPAPAPAPGLLNDAEGMEDAEDLEGVMELIGMQGAISNLFTNAMFASVFVSCTIVLAVWGPFIFGKVVLMMVAHPLGTIRTPLKMVVLATNAIADFGLLLFSGIFRWLFLMPASLIIRSLAGPFPHWIEDAISLTSIQSSVGAAMSKAARDLLDILRTTIESIDVMYSHITFDSHAAVTLLQHIFADAFHGLTISLHNFLATVQSLSLYDNVSLSTLYASCVSTAFSIKNWAWDVHSKTNVRHLAQLSNTTIPGVSSSLSSQEMVDAPVWTALDRSLVTTIGYATIAIAGTLYFTRFAPMAKSRQNKKIETVIIEILQQAGGISKVVLIISIEMLAFPLYCGLLLDVALIPLFKGASINNRMAFFKTSPLTSLFVHWFTGTAYMFHFALFVAMCRRNFRKGVLYFIRDPDDPNFHPVRDVLERTVLAQLRKIAHSALIYGGLVIICIGSLVWGLDYLTQDVLPVRWTPYSGANAFPLDLVVYILFRPILLKHLALSDWLQDIYKWFFKKSARALYLAPFLFANSNSIKFDNSQDHDPENIEFSKDRGLTWGKWLRVPASDQVRVGRGNKAFVEVDEEGKRSDRLPEPLNAAGKRPKDTDYTIVFAPPLFKLRLGIFVAWLWLLTASIGFSMTVLPLVIGRKILSQFIPTSTVVSDVHAFAAGVAGVCGLAVMVTQIKDLTGAQLSTSRLSDGLKVQVRALDSSGIKATCKNLVRITTRYITQAVRCFYVHGMLWIVTALTLAMMVHLYVLAPISTCLSPEHKPHVIHLPESEVIGIQLVRIMLLLLTWNEDSRSARAMSLIFEAGHLNPSVSLANRYLFLPTLLVSMLALLPPIFGAWIVNSTFTIDSSSRTQMLVRVLSYPMALSLLITIWVVHLLVRATSRWRMRIRDEVFLIGERLHNYGEKKPPTNVPHAATRILQ